MLADLRCKKCDHEEKDVLFFSADWKEEVQRKKFACVKCGSILWEKQVSNIAYGKLKTPFHKTD